MHEHTAIAVNVPVAAGGEWPRNGAGPRNGALHARDTGANCSDLDTQLQSISKTVANYRLLVRDVVLAGEKARAWWWRGASSGTPSAELSSRRESLKQEFVAKKLSIRALLALEAASLAPGGSSTSRAGRRVLSWGGADTALAAAAEERRQRVARAEAALAETQAQFREVDAEWKETWLRRQTRDGGGLLGGSGPAPAPSASAPAPSASARRQEQGRRRHSEQQEAAAAATTTDGRLADAAAIEASTTRKLREAHATLTATTAMGAATAHSLAEDREKVSRAERELDAADAELGVARTLLVRFAKGLMADRILWALGSLVVVGGVALAVYYAEVVAPARAAAAAAAAAAAGAGGGGG